MRRRPETTIVTAFLGVNIIVLICSGLLAGSRRYMGGMGVCFFSAVYAAGCCVCIVLNHKIESRFVALAERITGRPVPDRLGGKFVPKSDIIFMLIFHVVTVLLAIHAFNRERWLLLCILLALFLVGNSVSTAATVWLKVKTRSERLEELVSRSREGEAHATKAEP